MAVIMTLEVSVTTERDPENHRWKASAVLSAVTVGPGGGRTEIHSTDRYDADVHVAMQKAAGAVLEVHGHFRRTYMAQCARD
jgi:hypothetical protein